MILCVLLWIVCFLALQIGFSRQAHFLLWVDCPLGTANVLLTSGATRTVSATFIAPNVSFWWASLHYRYLWAEDRAIGRYCCSKAQRWSWACLYSSNWPCTNIATWYFPNDLFLGYSRSGLGGQIPCAKCKGVVRLTPDHSRMVSPSLAFLRRLSHVNFWVVEKILPTLPLPLLWESQQIFLASSIPFSTKIS